MVDLRGRVAMVTGGTRGIGAATARALLVAGADVALTGRDPASAASAAAEAEAAAAAAVGTAGRALGLSADVRDPVALRHAVAATLARFGRLDAVVANAGIGRMASVRDLSDEDWQAVIDTNLSGVFHTARAALDALIASGGTLLTIGSLAGAHAFAGGAAYNASKFGLVGLSEALMHDLRDLGVRVATVMPGSVATGFSPRAGGADDGWKLRPEDVAEAVLYVLGNPSRALPSRIELRPARRRPARSP